MQLNGIGSSRVSALPDMSRIIVLPELSFAGRRTDNSPLMSGSASAMAKAIPFVVHITQHLFSQPRGNLLNGEPGGKGACLQK